MEQPKEMPNPSIDLRSFAFSTASSSSNQSRLSKPRLVKQRRRVSRPVDAWNPFHSPNLHHATDSVPSSGKGFVFGSSTSFPVPNSSATGKDGNFTGFVWRTESGFGADKEACTSKMEKLHIETKGAGSKGDFTFGSSKNIVNSFEDDTANKFHENFKKLNIESQLSKNLEDINKDSGGGTASTFLFDDDIANKFPENFMKLNIENQFSKKMEDINKDSDGGSALPETTVQHSNAGSKGDFTFGTSNFFANSFNDEIQNKFPEKFKNLNIKKQPSENLEDINKDPEAASVFSETDANNINAAGKGVFTFGSSKNVVNSFDDDIANKFPEKFKKLNIKNPSSQNLQDTDKDSEEVNAFPNVHETGVKNIFAPENKPNNSEESTSDNFLHDKLKLNNGDSFNIFNIFENSGTSDFRNNLHLPKKEALFSEIGGKVNSESYQDVKHNDSIAGSSILDFKFRAGNQDIATGSSYSSFTDSGFTSGAAGFTFTGCGAGDSYVDSKTQNNNTPFPSEDNMFKEMCQNRAFGIKKEVKGSMSRSRKGKSWRTAQSHPKMDSASFQKDKIANENSEFDSPGHFSPMDSSPYEEILVCEINSGPSESGTFDSYHTSTNAQHSTGQHFDVTEDNSIKNPEFQADATKDDSECFLDAKSSFLEEEEDGEEVESSRRDKEGLTENTSSYYSCYNNLTENKFIFSSSPSFRNHPTELKQDFTFCSALNNDSHDAKANGSGFTFATDASTEHASSLLKQLHKRKSRIKNTKKSYKTTPFGNINVDSPSSFPSPHLSGSLQSNSKWNHAHEGDLFISEKIFEKNIVGGKDPEIKRESTSSTILHTAAREACENWRLKGNQAYTTGNLSKAEDYYTRGLNCVSSNENSRSCNHLLVLCYSNRAATRMSLSRMREALNDCLLAIAIEPNFHKAQLRAANCHLSLGEIEDASTLFKKCFQVFKCDNLGSKFLEEASDGLRKTKVVADGMCLSSEILKTRTCSDAKNALSTISEMLLISPQSERLLEMKADALLLLRKYNEVIELCEKTMKSSEINSSFIQADDPLIEGDTDHIKPYEIWRWHVISRSYFYLGKLEEVIKLLQCHNLVGPIREECRRKSLEPFAWLFDTVKELLRLKDMGNNAFKERRHLEAVEHYTAALACSVESRPFAAICFCNRAAAYQALNQITDAIADCSLAIALDENYPKAISRRATLYELIRDYDQANNDLGRLISLLKKQSGAMVSPSSDGAILTRAHTRLACVQDEARRGIPLNMYKILGVESSSTTVDIKKAYRKAALKHHPDKVLQFLVKGEKSNDNIWNDVSDVLHKDADHVFKMIGEAYSILSDTTKREQYDAEEEMRIILKKGDGVPQRHPGEYHYSRSDKSNMRRHSESTWNSHGRQRQRWSESAYSSRYYY